jgi:DNA-directed RNA polymerase subunit K/omega
MDEDILHDSSEEIFDTEDEHYSEIDELEEDPNQDLDDYIFDDDCDGNIMAREKPDTFLSIKRLTKYERCRLLSIRTQQLTIGCPCNLSKDQLSGLKDYISIARKELDLGLIPMKISRKLQNNIIELI